MYMCVCVWRWFRAIKPSRIWLQTFSRQTKPQVFKYQIILSFSHSNVLSFFLSCLQRDLHAECIFTSRSNERLSADKVYDVFSFVAKPYQSFEPFGKQKKRLWWSSSSWEYLSKRFSKKTFLFLMSIDKNGNCCQVFHHIYFLNNFPVNNFMNFNFFTLLNVPHCWFPTFIITWKIFFFVSLSF